MHAPILLVAIPLLAGTAAGVLLLDHIHGQLILASGGAAVLSLLSAAGFFADDDAAGLVVAVCAGSFCSGLAGGAAIAASLESPTIVAWHETYEPSGEPVVVEGRLREDVIPGQAGTLIELDVGRGCDVGGRCVPVRGGVRLSLGGSAEPSLLRHWRAGRMIRAPVLLRRPTTFANPGLEDEGRGLARRGIALVGTVKSATLVEIRSRGTFAEERAADVRDWIRRRLTLHVAPYDPRSAGVATAILIGDRTGLAEDDQRRLQDAGTYHVIAISGGNIAIFTGLLLVLTRLFRLPYRGALVAILLVLLFYGEVAGGSASVSRAITVAVIFLSALILDHRGSTLNVLGTAAVLAVMVNPVAVVDAGFLLSFGATAGIILGVPLLVTWQPDRRRPFAIRALGAVRAAVIAVFAASVCAEIALLPVTASLFSRVTLAGLLLNFAAIPLMTLVQCGSMLLLLLAVFGLEAAHHVALAVHASATGLVESARLVTWTPWLVRDVLPPSWWMCGLYYSLAVTLVAAARLRRFMLLPLVSAVALVFWAPAFSSHGAVAPPPTGILRVVVLDVGQGDATVAMLPDGRAVLVDTGGLAGTTFDIGGRVIMPALRALGVRRLHALVLTHPDPDHIGGADVILRRLSTHNVWEGVPVPPNAPRRHVLETAAGQRIAWRTLRPTDLEVLGGVAITAHHPPAPDWERQRVRNDDSVVLELRYHDVSILLPGDIGAGIETSLSAQLEPAPLTILKAAHHGSATSSSEAFIDALNPRAVIFSAGKNNRFNHPAPVVVDRFARRGIEMFNTAHDGAVFVETDGRVVQIRGWKNGRRLSIAKGDTDGDR